MSRFITFIAAFLVVAAADAQSSFPIRHGVLQTPLDAAGHRIDNLDLAGSGIPTPTNQVVTVDGQVFTITNAPAAAGDVLVFDPASTTAYFAAQAGGGGGGAELIAISGRVDNVESNLAAHSGNSANPHGVTPAQIGALSGSSNLADVADAGIARSNLGAAAQVDMEQIVSQTNQVIAVDGQVFTITNAPAAAGDVLVFNPASTTAYFSAQSGGGGLTEAEVKNVSPLMTNTQDVILGYYANASSQGTAIGYLSSATSSGIGVGRSAYGNNNGVGIGWQAFGNTYGVALGRDANGSTYGVAVGYKSYAPNYAAALGYLSWATNYSGAIGQGVTNTITNTTRVRGDLYLDGGTKIYVRENFNSGEFSELATGGATAGTYPVFAIPLGGAWTDFEIKASTNNFADLCYYYKSWTNTQDATRGDTNALAYFTDDHAEDVRVWNLKTQTSAISEMLTSTNSEVETVYFYPSHDCTIPWSEWMSSTNAALVWSYVRVDDLGFEMNASGTKQHWSPIRPDSWEIERTMP